MTKYLSAAYFFIFLFGAGLYLIIFNDDISVRAIHGKNHHNHRLFLGGSLIFSALYILYIVFRYKDK